MSVSTSPATSNAPELLRNIYHVFEDVPFAVAVLSGESLIIDFINKYNLDIWGSKKEDVLGKPLFDARPQIRESVEHIHAEIYRTGQRFIANEIPFEQIIDGQPVIRYFNAVIDPMYDNSGKIVGQLATTIEITEQVTARQKVEQSQQQIGNLANAMPQLVWIADPSGKVTYYNDRVAEYAGEKRQPDGSWKWEGLIHPDDIDATNNAWNTACRENSVYEIEHRVQMRDGEFRWHLSRAFSETDEKGNVIKWFGTATDVHEHREAAERVKENEEQLRIAVESGEFGLFDLNVQTGKMEWSSKTKEMFGLPPEAEVDYDLFLSALHPDDRERTDTTVKKAMQPDSGGRYENEYRTIGITDGRLRWVRSKGRVSFDAEGKPVRFIGVIQEITKQKEIFASLKLQSLVLESMDEGVSVSDENGVIMLTNPAEDKMFGYEAGELIGQHVSIQNAYHPDENMVIVNTVIEELKRNGFWSGEWHNRKKDGTPFYTHSFITSIQVDGKMLFVCVQRDITEEKRAAEALKESEGRFRTMAETLPQKIWVRSMDGVIEFASKSWEEYTGIKDLKEAWRHATHPEDWEPIMQVWQEAFTTGVPFQHEVRLKNKDGEYRWHHAVGEPVHDHTGKLIKYIGALTDIHVQKTFAEKLETLVAERTEELQRSNEDLQQFAHVASHDLKEPVRKIRTFGSRIAEEFAPELPDKARLYVSKIESAASRLTDMIDGVLMYSSVESQQVENEVIELDKTLRQIEDDLELLISQKSAVIKYNNLTPLEGSPLLLYQLFYNLINNSLKFSKKDVPPIIEITSEILTGDQLNATGLADTAEKFVLLKLKDNGIGFRPEEAERIFKTFSRLHSKDMYEGTGLGLALSKKIVDRHGGFISATSQEGNGAVFNIVLPVKQMTKQAVSGRESIQSA